MKRLGGQPINNQIYLKSGHYCVNLATNASNHVLQHLQEEVHNQQVAFEELQKMAAQVQGADSRLVSLCTQLNTRYQTAKTSLRVSTFSSRLY